MKENEEFYGRGYLKVFTANELCIYYLHSTDIFLARFHSLERQHGGSQPPILTSISAEVRRVQCLPTSTGPHLLLPQTQSPLLLDCTTQIEVAEREKWEECVEIASFFLFHWLYIAPLRKTDFPGTTGIFT